MMAVNVSLTAKTGYLSFKAKKNKIKCYKTKYVNGNIFISRNKIVIVYPLSEGRL